MLEKFPENSGKVRKIFGSILEKLKTIRQALEKFRLKIGNRSGGAFGKNSGNTQKIEKDFELSRQGLHNPLLYKLKR